MSFIQEGYQKFLNCGGAVCSYITKLDASEDKFGGGTLLEQLKGRARDIRVSQITLFMVAAIASYCITHAALGKLEIMGYLLLGGSGFIGVLKTRDWIIQKTARDRELKQFKTEGGAEGANTKYTFDDYFQEQQEQLRGLLHRHLPQIF